MLTLNPETNGGLNGATAQNIYRGFSPGFPLINPGLRLFSIDGHYTGFVTLRGQFETVRSLIYPAILSCIVYPHNLVIMGIFLYILCWNRAFWHGFCDIL